MFRSPAPARFRTGCPLLGQPRTLPLATEPEVTRSRRRRPGRRRDLARQSERQESVKEARSPSAKTAARLGGGAGAAGGLEALHACEDPLQTGLGFPGKHSSVASHATSPQL